MNLKESKPREDLEIVKGWLAIARESNNKLAIRVIENLFPELKESEDNMIRKALIKGFQHYDKECKCGEFTTTEILAWLEKQGGQKSDEGHLEDEQNFNANLNVVLGYIDDEYLRKWLKDIIYVKYGKTFWSDDDIDMVKDAIYWIHEFQKSNRCKDENDMQNSVTCENWLKSIIGINNNE